MFLIWGIRNGQKDIEYNRMVICARCGSYGRYGVFMTFSVFTLFFIPVFRFGKRFFVRTSCCGTICELDKEIGRALLRGEDVEILPEHLTGAYGGEKPKRRCRSCGYEADDSFTFCPKCGNRL